MWNYNIVDTLIPKHNKHHSALRNKKSEIKHDRRSRSNTQSTAVQSRENSVINLQKYLRSVVSVRLRRSTYQGYVRTTTNLIVPVLYYSSANVEDRKFPCQQIYQYFWV